MSIQGRFTDVLRFVLYCPACHDPNAAPTAEAVFQQNSGFASEFRAQRLDGDVSWRFSVVRTLGFSWLGHAARLWLVADKRSAALDFAASCEGALLMACLLGVIQLLYGIQV